jgi:hypothetical protein
LRAPPFKGKKKEWIKQHRPVDKPDTGRLVRVTTEKLKKKEKKYNTDLLTNPILGDLYG